MAVILISTGSIIKDLSENGGVKTLLESAGEGM